MYQNCIPFWFFFSQTSLFYRMQNRLPISSSMEIIKGNFLYFVIKTTWKYWLLTAFVRKTFYSSFPSCFCIIIEINHIKSWNDMFVHLLLTHEIIIWEHFFVYIILSQLVLFKVMLVLKIIKCVIFQSFI